MWDSTKGAQVFIQHRELVWWIRNVKNVEGVEKIPLGNFRKFIEASVKNGHKWYPSTELCLKEVWGLVSEVFWDKWKK